MAEHGHPDSTSTRPERNHDCAVCRGRIRHYPSPSGGPGRWAHLNREDWIENPHEPEPSAEALVAAQAEG